MRDEIRHPNKIVWVVAGVIALLCAISVLLIPSSQREPSPPSDLRLFLVTPPSREFSVTRAWQQVKKNPNDIATLLEIQQYYAYQGEWEKAVEIGKRVVRSPQGLREGNAYLGIIYAMIYLGRVEAAREWIAVGLQKVADKQQRAQLHRTLGDILLLQYVRKRDHYSLAMAELSYHQALQAWHQYSFAKAQLAYVKFRQGNFKSARQLIREVLNSSESTERDKAVATYYLAQLEETSGNTDLAKRLYSQAEQMHPESFIQRPSNR